MSLKSYENLWKKVKIEYVKMSAATSKNNLFTVDARLKFVLF